MIINTCIQGLCAGYYNIDKTACVQCRKHTLRHAEVGIHEADIVVKIGSMPWCTVVTF
jgi:hypothetical protein